MQREPDVPAPQSERELLERARSLSGLSLACIARQTGSRVPADQLRAKGWVGGLLERCLGATAGSRAAPDFEALGVELKTLPVDARSRPKESTFVCTIELSDIGYVEWEYSRVRLKLSRVLWLPIEADTTIPIADRRIGSPLLWSPDADEEAELRFDWEELAGLIGRGELEFVTGHLGKSLQVRPKAANSRVRRVSFDVDGAYCTAPPRGFYLRTTFTERLLRNHFAMPAAARG